MKSVGSVLVAIGVLSGCVHSVHNGAMTQEEQLQIMREVEASRRAAAGAFPQFRDVCVREFPEASNPRDDGGTRLSAQGAVNVALHNYGQEIVCSVSIANSAIDRIWADNRVYSLREYKLLEAERGRRFAVAQVEAAQILSGNHADFLRAAKRSITNGFKDPDSVVYRDLMISNRKTPTLCGELNAKNSYGGYVGYKRFFYNRAISDVDNSETPEGRQQYSKLDAIYCRDKVIDLSQ